MGEIWHTDTPVLRSADVRDLLALHSEHLIDGTPSKSQVLNQRLLEADGFRLTESNEQPVSKRIAIVSLLFNWPSTGGGIVHTAELAQFLSVDGYDVCHFFAVYEPWSVGGVREPLPYKSCAVQFDQHSWNREGIQTAFREAVDSFKPDAVIVTDSWNSKCKRRRETVTVDSGNRLTSFITPELCTTELRYDSDDRLTEVISPAGLRTTMAYTADGLCSQIKMPDGGTYQYNYVDWLNTTVTAPDSSVTQVEHYVSRQVKSIQGPVGAPSGFSYVARRLISRTEPSGERVTMSYVTLPNGARGLVGSAKADGRSTFVYDTSSRVKATIDASGARTTFLRNTAGLVTAQINAANFRTSFIYNGSGQRTAIIDPLGSRSTTVYDSVGNVVAQINPLSQRTTFSYVNGQKTAAKSPIGAISTSIYDLNNRILGQIDPLGARTSFIYESCTAPVATIRPDGSRTSSIYSFGRVQATINPLGQRQGDCATIGNLQ